MVSRLYETDKYNFVESSYRGMYISVAKETSLRYEVFLRHLTFIRLRVLQFVQTFLCTLIICSLQRVFVISKCHSISSSSVSNNRRSLPAFLRCHEHFCSLMPPPMFAFVFVQFASSASTILDVLRHRTNAIIFHFYANRSIRVARCGRCSRIPLKMSHSGEQLEWKRPASEQSASVECNSMELAMG